MQDENDNPPQFSQAQYTVSLEENSVSHSEADRTWSWPEIAQLPTDLSAQSLQSTISQNASPLEMSGAPDMSGTISTMTSRKRP